MTLATKLLKLLSTTKIKNILIVIVLFPLSLFSIIATKKVIHFCMMKWHHHYYDPINGFVDDDREPDVDLRYYI